MLTIPITCRSVNIIEVEIINPTTDSSFLQSEMVLLSGDASSGTAPYNYNWTSSIDGFIGNSSRIFTFSLSPGTHTITLSVLDSHGLSNSTSTIITVNRATTTNISGQSATDTMTWNASNFPALTSETLSVVSLTGRTIYLDNLTYTTSGRPKLLNVVENGKSDGISNGLLHFTAGEMSGIQGAYNAIGLFGTTYVGIKNHSFKLTKILLEQNDTDSKTLPTGETWNMGDGYSLKLNSVDIRALPAQAWLTLNKSDTRLDDYIISNGSIYT